MAEATPPEEKEDRTADLLGILTQQYRTTEEAQAEARRLLAGYTAGPSTEEQELVERRKESAESSRAALKEAQQRLLEKPFTRSESLLKLSAAFGRPTQTGSFGETMGFVAEAGAGEVKRKREFVAKREARNLEMEAGLRKIDDDLMEFELGLETLRRKSQATLAGKALSTLGKAATGTGRIIPEAYKSVDREFAKEYVKFAGGMSADAAKSLGELNGVISTLRGGSDKLTGPIVGTVTNLSLPYIGDVGRAVQDVIWPTGANARDIVESTVQRSLRPILGAQFTEKEGERLIARVYNPRMEEEVNAGRLERLVKSLERAYLEKVRMTQYFEDNGTLFGFKGKTSWTVDDLWTAEDDASEGEIIRVQMPDGEFVDVPVGSTQQDALRLYEKQKKRRAESPPRELKRGGRVRRRVRKQGGGRVSKIRELLGGVDQPEADRGMRRALGEGKVTPKEPERISTRRQRVPEPEVEFPQEGNVPRKVKAIGPSAKSGGYEHTTEGYGRNAQEAFEDLLDEYVDLGVPEEVVDRLKLKRGREIAEDTQAPDDDPNWEWELDVEGDPEDLKQIQNAENQYISGPDPDDPMGAGTHGPRPEDPAREEFLGRNIGPKYQRGGGVGSGGGEAVAFESLAAGVPLGELPEEEGTLEGLKSAIAAELHPDTGDILLGIAGGVTGSVVGPAISEGAARLSEMSGMAEGPTRGERRVMEAMDIAGEDVVETGAEVKRARRAGVPATMIEEGGPGTRALATRAMIEGGPRAEQAIDDIQERHDRSRTRVGERINKSLKPYPYFDQLERLTGELYENASPMYKAAYEKYPGISETDVPAFAEIMDTPDGKRAVRIALRLLRNQGKTIGAEDAIGLVHKPSLEFLDYVKRGFDQIITTEEARGPTPLGRSQRSLRNRLRDQLDVVAPEYTDARGQYAGDLEVLDALKAGKSDFHLLQPEEISRLMDQMSVAEKVAYRTGVAQNLYEMINRPVGDVNAARKLIGSPTMDRRLSMLFSKASESRIFRTALEREMKLFERTKKIAGAATRGRESRIGKELEEVGKRKLISPLMAAARIFTKPGLTLSATEADEIIEVLDTGSPKQVDALVKRFVPFQKRVGKLRRRRGKAAAIGAVIGALGAPFINEEVETN